MKIIPAIDLLDGKVTRLTKGDFEKTIEYIGSPLDYALKYEDEGFSSLHVVDLDASVTGKITTLKILEDIKLKTKLELQFGGGIKNAEAAKTLINSGVDKLIIGSIAVSNKEELEKIIRETNEINIIIAVDVKNEKVAVNGWKDLSDINIEEHIGYCVNKRLFSILCTDITKDGTLKGPNIGLYERIMRMFPSIKLIASGGVSSINDLLKLEKMEIDSVVVGKAIYEKKITLQELKRFA